MSLILSTNLASQSILRALNRNGEEQARSYVRLASGHRISQPGDDAAGLAISENLRAQIRSLSQSGRNANDGVSFIQVAEGGLSEISNIMIRLRELGIQAASDTLGDHERAVVHREAQLLIQEVDRIAQSTQFNGIPLLNSQANHNPLEFQVGIQNEPNSRITFNVGDVDSRSSTLGIDSLNFETIESARETLDKVDSALTQVSGGRALLGATQNRLQSAVRSLEASRDHLLGTQSRIADVDVAVEISELIRSQISHALGVSVLVQANAQAQLALKLL